MPAPGRSLLSLILWFTALIAIGISDRCYAIDYFIVIDTSGSMGGPISNKDRRPRLPVVQGALRDFIQSLPGDSHVTLIPFNSGITEMREFVLNAPGEREGAKSFVENLKAGGDTWLWSTTATTLERAKAAYEKDPTNPVMVWILTDGEDTQRTLTLERVLEKFPQVDGQHIVKSLVLLGDMQMYLSAADRKAAGQHGVQFLSSPSFDQVMPPVIDWNPKPVRVGTPITFEEKSGGTFKLYRWHRDNDQVGLGRSVTLTFERPGRSKVRIAVANANGREISVEREVEILEKERIPLNPKIRVSEATPEPGQKVIFELSTSVAPKSVQWLVNGTPRAQQVPWVAAFDAANKYSVVAEATDDRGITEKSPPVEVDVREPKVTISFSTTKNEIDDGEEAQFINTSSKNLQRFQWDFGDGTTSAAQDARRVFRNNTREVKDYNVTLTGWTIGGRAFKSDPFTLKVLPEKRPLAGLNIVGDRFFTDQIILAVSTTTGASDEQIRWNFNGEKSATGKTAEVSFDSSGEKTITITATGPTGLTDSATKKIQVDQKEYPISVKWLGSITQDDAMPKEIYFDEVPNSLLGSSGYRRPPNDSFQVAAPEGIPAGSGYAIELVSKKGPSTFQVVDITTEPARPLGTGVIIGTARYRIEFSPNAKVGNSEMMLVITPKGRGVSLNNSKNAVEVKVYGAIVEPFSPGPWLLGLGVPIFAGLAWFIWKNVVAGSTALSGPVEISIDILPEKGGTEIKPTTIHRLEENESLYLGRDQATPRDAKICDLGAPDKMIVHSGGALRLSTLGDPAEGKKLVSGKTTKLSLPSGDMLHIQVIITPLESPITS